MKLSLLLALGIAVISGIASPSAQASCPLSFPKTGLCASATWDAQPSAARPNAFTLRFWSASQGTDAGPYLSPSQELFVRLWMPSMGHGSRPVTLTPARDASGAALPGIFRVEKVVFTMRGDWDVQVQLKNGSQVLEQSVLELEL